MPRSQAALVSFFSFALPLHLNMETDRWRQDTYNDTSSIAFTIILVIRSLILFTENIPEYFFIIPLSTGEIYYLLTLLLLLRLQYFHVCNVRKYSYLLAVDGDRITWRFIFKQTPSNWKKKVTNNGAIWCLTDFFPR